MLTVVVVGNPRPASRTLAAATLVAQRVTGQDPEATIDLVTLGSGLLDPADAQVAAAKATVLSADLLVVASPTYKATYSGVLKLFLDMFGAGELDGCPTIALMVGGAAQHALAVQYTLTPVLVEIGCSCPAPGLFLLDREYDAPSALDTWLPRALRSLPAANGS
jgi:FMN reductase